MNVIPDRLHKIDAEVLQVWYNGTMFTNTDGFLFYFIFDNETLATSHVFMVSVYSNSFH